MRSLEEWDRGQIKNTAPVQGYVYGYGYFFDQHIKKFQFFNCVPILFKHCLFTVIFGHQEGENKKNDKKSDGGETFSRERFEELQEKVFTNIEKERNYQIKRLK